MTVKGWNPETKELITGDADAQSSQARLAERGRRLGRSRQRGDVHRRSSDLERRKRRRRSPRRGCSDSTSRTSPAKPSVAGNAEVRPRQGRQGRCERRRDEATIRSTASTTSWASPTATRCQGQGAAASSTILQVRARRAGGSSHARRRTHASSRWINVQYGLHYGIVVPEQGSGQPRPRQGPVAVARQRRHRSDALGAAR